MTTRIARHKVTKQAILGAVYEDEECRNHHPYNSMIGTNHPPLSNINNNNNNNNDNNHNNNNSGGDVVGGFFCHNNHTNTIMDGTDKVAIMSTLEDLEKELKRRQEILFDEAERITEAQQLIVFNKAMKIEKNVKKMTIREFNQTYGVDVVSTVKTFLNNILHETNNSPTTKKRILTTTTTTTSSNNQQTPGGIFTKKKINIMATPYTITRTVRKGEIMYSSNGSPVCSTNNDTELMEEGDLLATISKKRKGTKIIPNFDARINVGDGRFVTLSDATTYQHLDQSLKENAIEQVSELQEQMALLIEKLKSQT